MLQCAGVFGVKLRIVMCPIIGDGVMFDDGQRQLDPQDGPPPSLPTISPLRIALRTRRTSPLSQSDLVHWSIAEVAPPLGGRAILCRTNAGISQKRIWNFAVRQT